MSEGANAGQSAGTTGTTTTTQAAASTTDAGASTGGTQSTAGAGGTAGATTTAKDWTADLAELDRGYVQNKGWKQPSDLLMSYKNMEQFRGVPETQLLKLPTDLNDKKAMGGVYDRMGRPPKPEGYEIKGADGKVGEFQNWAASVFHEAGLSKAQATEIVTKWNEQQKAITEANAKAFDEKMGLEDQGLKKEWGAHYPDRIREAKLAAEQFGVGPEELDALEQGLGYAKVIKFFQRIGAKMGESGFVTGANRGFGSMSPEAAKARIESLKADKEWVKRWSEGGMSEREELKRLHEYINP